MKCTVNTGKLLSLKKILYDISSCKKVKTRCYVKHYVHSSSFTVRAKFHLKSECDLQGQDHMGLKIVSIERPCHKEDKW